MLDQQATSLRALSPKASLFLTLSLFQTPLPEFSAPPANCFSEPRPSPSAPAVLAKVVDLAVEHKYLNQLLDLSPDPLLVVSIATQTAQAGQLGLNEWLSGVLGGDKPPAAKALLARAFIRYAEEKVHSEEEKGGQAGTAGKAAFPAEVIEEIFKALPGGQLPPTPKGLPPLTRVSLTHLAR